MTKKIFATLIALIICLSSAISASAYTQQYVIDYADKLSSSEIEELDLFAEKLETAYGIAVLFCITEGTGDVTADEFSSKTYGDYTDNENGLIIVHDDWNKTYFSFISGNADEYFSDAAVDSMIDAYDLNESYYGGIYACYELAGEYLENGYSGGYVYESEEFVYAGEADEPKTENEKDGVSIIWLPVSLLIGLLVGFLIINGIASKNKSVKMQKNATVYTRPGSMVITGSADNFLYNNVERREKPKQAEKNKEALPMGFFDSLKRQAESALKREVSQGINKAVNNAVQSVGKGRNHTETFTFASLPTNVAELKALPEASLDSAFKTTALTLAALCNYEHNPDATIEMLNFLKGPGEVSGLEKQFIKEHLGSDPYKARSYFEGANPQNSYKPDVPYKITVIENPYSFDNADWATLYVQSGGADNPRPMKLRRKPSTGQWFLVEIQCLSDIRVPVEEDPGHK